MKESLQHLMAKASAFIHTVSVHAVPEAVQSHDGVFIEIRDSAKPKKPGLICWGIAAPLRYLEFFVDPESITDKPESSSGNRLWLHCSSANQSVKAAKTLFDIVVPSVAHMARGIEAWREAGGHMATAE